MPGLLKTVIYNGIIATDVECQILRLLLLRQCCSNYYVYSNKQREYYSTWCLTVIFVYYVIDSTVSVNCLQLLVQKLHT